MLSCIIINKIIRSWNLCFKQTLPVEIRNGQKCSSQKILANFFSYLSHTFKIFQVAIIPNCSILATVGQKMASTPGVSATLFNALAKVSNHIFLVRLVYGSYDFISINISIDFKEICFSCYVNALLLIGHLLCLYNDYTICLYKLSSIPDLLITPNDWFGTNNPCRPT